MPKFTRERMAFYNIMIGTENHETCFCHQRQRQRQTYRIFQFLVSSIKWLSPTMMPESYSLAWITRMQTKRKSNETTFSAKMWYPKWIIFHGKQTYDWVTYMPVPSMNLQSLSQMRQRCRKPNGYYCNGFHARGKPPQNYRMGGMYVLIEHTDIIVVTFIKKTQQQISNGRRKKKLYVK